MPLIIVKDLCCGYDAGLVLKNLSFTVDEEPLLHPEGCEAPVIVSIVSDIKRPGKSRKKADSPGILL